jgi:hypothetical protein
LKLLPINRVFSNWVAEGLHFPAIGQQPTSSTAS